MTFSVLGASKSLLALAMMTTLAACGGGGGSGDGVAAPGDNTDGGTTTPPPITGNPDDGDTEVSAVSWDAKSTMVSNTGNLEKDPMIEISESGDLIASWIDTDSDTIWARAYDKSEGSWGNAKQLHSQAETIFNYTFGSNQSIEYIGDTAMIVWAQDGIAYSSIHDENGWAGNPQVIGGASDAMTANGVKLTPKKDGSGFVATFEAYTGTDNLIYAAEYSLATNTWGETTLLGVNAVRFYDGAPLTTDPETGAVYAVWQQEVGDGYALYTSTLTDGTWSDSELITSGYFESFTVEADPASDRPMVAWATAANGTVDVARYAEGSWSALRLDAAGNRKSHISSAVMADGDILLTYQGEPTPDMEQIFTQRLDVETGEWGNKTATDNQFRVFRPSVAADGNGRAVVAYYNYNTWVTDYTEENGWSTDYQPNGLNSGRENTVVMNEAGDTALIWRDSNSSGGIHVLMGR